MISQHPAAALDPLLRIGRQMDDILRSHTSLPRGQHRANADELLGRLQSD